MKWEATTSSKADFKPLSRQEQKLFGAAVDKFNVACDQWVESEGRSDWPSALRVKSVESAPGINEVTWNFSGPDGRATWEWVTIDVNGQRSGPAVAPHRRTRDVQEILTTDCTVWPGLPRCWWALQDSNL
ncbi:hypothetical protein BH20ACT7_BH20ACT7_06780 [soil metagenome]